MLWDINKEANDAVAKEITEKGQVAHAFYCDCSKREDIYHTAAQVCCDYDIMPIKTYCMYSVRISAN